MSDSVNFFDLYTGSKEVDCEIKVCSDVLPSVSANLNNRNNNNSSSSNNLLYYLG